MRFLINRKQRGIRRIYSKSSRFEKILRIISWGRNFRSLSFA